MSYMFSIGQLRSIHAIPRDLSVTCCLQTLQTHLLTNNMARKVFFFFFFFFWVVLPWCYNTGILFRKHYVQVPYAVMDMDLICLNYVLQ